jgi:hypothetical protein
MISEKTFMLGVLVIVVITVALLEIRKSWPRIRRMLLNQLNIGLDRLRAWLKIVKRTAEDSEKPFSASVPVDLTPEESKAELARLHSLIEDKKKIARDTDISHHLWGLYTNLVRHTDPKSLDYFIQDGEWYDVKILQASTEDGLNKYTFELKGAHYTFVDDEEQQSWRVNLKLFSLFLYDDSGHCLIEIPMKVQVDGMDRKYTIAAGGPEAFLSGSWINDFTYVKLKQQRMRNQEIREQKHQERLFEIEELKERFGISD